MAGTKRERRRYSDEERAAALAALAANGGNVGRTARELGIAETTVRHWATGDRHPEAAQMGERKKQDMATALEGVAWKLLRSLPKKVAKAPLNQAATAMGIAIDKARLLRGEPTQIDEHRGGVTLRIDRLTAAFAGVADRQGEGGAPGNRLGEPLGSAGGPRRTDHEAG